MYSDFPLANVLRRLHLKLDSSGRKMPMACRVNRNNGTYTFNSSLFTDEFYSHAKHKGEASFNDNFSLTKLIVVRFLILFEIILILSLFRLLELLLFLRCKEAPDQKQEKRSSANKNWRYFFLSDWGYCCNKSFSLIWCFVLLFTVSTLYRLVMTKSFNKVLSSLELINFYYWTLVVSVL